MDITVNKLFGDQSNSNNRVTSPMWFGSMSSTNMKRAISDHYIHDKLSVDSGIICTGTTSGLPGGPDYGDLKGVSNRGVPQSLTKFFDEDDEDVLALGMGNEVSGSREMNCNNELSCHNRELDWVVYVESFAERYYMEQNGMVDKIPQPKSYEEEIERMVLKRRETKTLSSTTKRGFVDRIVSESRMTNEKSDSPLYFGNSSVVLVKDKRYLKDLTPSQCSPWHTLPEDRPNSTGKNFTSWNDRHNFFQGARSRPTYLSFFDFISSNPNHAQIQERKRRLRLPGLVDPCNRIQKVFIKHQTLARKRSVSCSSVSPSSCFLSSENILGEACQSSTNTEEAVSDFGQLNANSCEAVEYTQTQCMVQSIVKTCAEIRSVYSKHLKYTDATDKGFAELTAANGKKASRGFNTDWRRKRDEMQSRELSHLVLSELCPTLFDFIATGLSSKYTPWEIVRLGAVPVPGVTCIHELCLSVSVMVELESAEEKFNSFIFGLLNQKIMETWLLLLLKNSSLIIGCYETYGHRNSRPSSGLSSQQNSSTWGKIICAGLPSLLSDKMLFTELLLAVQPLAFICFYTDLRFEINYLKHNFSQALNSQLDLTPVSTNQHVLTDQPSRNDNPNEIRVMSTYWASPSGSFRKDSTSNSRRSSMCNPATSGTTRTRLRADDLTGDLPKVAGSYKCWDLVEASLGTLMRHVGCDNKNFQEGDINDPVTYV